MHVLTEILVFVILASLFMPFVQQKMLDGARLRLLQKLEKQRGTRAIALIHRQESMALLGIPILHYIDIDDSENVLRAIRLTAEDMPIDIILHTPGGLVIAAEQIALALERHKGKVTVFVPHYAMSGGTLIAMAADEVRLDEDAVLGPLDPQIGEYPAASIVKAIERKAINEIDDRTLILADVAEKALVQVRQFVTELLARRMEPEQADKVAREMTEGRWTHDYPITVDKANEIGLRVESGVPTLVHDLMALYPQPGQRRPSVQYVPLPYGGHPSTPTRTPTR